MYFKEIEIKNFRNYKSAGVSFHPEINIFTGDNGQGKTSLAEAIYTMCLGRSFRTQRDRDMIKFGEEAAVVRSVVCKNDRNIRTDLVISRSERKKIKINGVPKKRQELSNNILIVAFSPDDLKIVKEDPDKRRRFLNREICQLSPSYYEAIGAYTKILSQRNTLLKGERPDSGLLGVWNEELVRYGSRVIRERKLFTDRLSEISSVIHGEISNGKEELLLEYESDISYSDDIEEIKNDFRKKVEASERTDLLRRSTSVGPHHDDIKISINGTDVRKFGSQGQQRTAALSLKLAEIKLIEEETGEKPVLILDDVLSELDKTRQQYLIETLEGVQIFLTTTFISPEIASQFKEKSVFEINDGNVKKRLE